MTQSDTRMDEEADEYIGGKDGDTEEILVRLYRLEARVKNLEKKMFWLF